MKVKELHNISYNRLTVQDNTYPEPYAFASCVSKSICLAQYYMRLEVCQTNGEHTTVAFLTVFMGYLTA